MGSLKLTVSIIQMKNLYIRLWQIVWRRMSEIIVLFKEHDKNWSWFEKKL